jgi:predicted HicB family RNase H-like nuclease
MSASELVYKGYTGSIEVSLEDSCLHGRVLFIDDLITYEGNTVGEIKTAFENATDRYISYCERTGKPANKPYSGTFNVRVGADRHRALALLAFRSKTSINEVVCQALDSYQKVPPLSVGLAGRVFLYGRRSDDLPSGMVISNPVSSPAASLRVFDFINKASVELADTVAINQPYGTC